MQIQSGERAVWRCAGTVTRRARRDTMRSEVGYCEKVPREAWLEKVQEEIGSAARRRSPERFETRGSFELEKVVSCRSRDQRWRAKLDFGSGESFDDLHCSSTLGTGIKIRSVFGGGSVLFGLGLLCRAEQVKAKWQESGALAVGQEAEVADAHETLGEQVQ
jgi:hypothetical protein